MATLLVLVAVVMGAAGAVFYAAQKQVYFGTSWAVDVCSSSKLLCGHPEYLAYAAAATLTLGLGLLLGRAFSGE